VLRLAGPSAAFSGATPLEGGQHAATWRVDTDDPPLSVVVREYPAGDDGAASEQTVLRALDGLDGLAPVLLDGDPSARWSEHPTSLISWLDGSADITPAHPERWADELGRALAVVHAVPGQRLAGLPIVFDRPAGSEAALRGPLASVVRSRWARIVSVPHVLTHSDYWSGNVVWRDGHLVGVVDWSGGARGPRGFDLGWCRLDLVLLFDERIADVFSDAYQAAAGHAIDDMPLWDSWAAARSHDGVGEWGPNYAPLGRADLDERALRSRHREWTEHLLGYAVPPG
jgi:aminoglycoside phosphotransferase (APT) family kinase protein